MKIFLLCSLLLLNQACTTGLAIGTISSSYLVARDKKLSETKQDFKILLKIKDNIIASDYTMTMMSVEIDVHNKNVYLMGRVKTNEARLFLLASAEKVEGVKKIYDEIVVNSSASWPRSIATFARDAIVTAEVKLRLMMSKNIKSFNYSIETFNGSVYIIGNSFNKNEAEHVSLVASRSLGASRIVNYSTIIE
jgi:osmotically-inducible protein OsmY